MPGGQGLAQFGDLGLAFVLSALIGLEREIRQKWAGLRTHTLVGAAAALIMLVSKYGFTDVLAPGRIVLDSSRVAAQIVSGIGFLGAGLIFVRRDAVRGLTTAAGIWATAAVGMACGAGLAWLALAATGLYFVALFGLTPLERRLSRAGRGSWQLRLLYRTGNGTLRRAVAACISLGFTVAGISTEEPCRARLPSAAPGENPAGTAGGRQPGTTWVTLTLHGSGSAAELAGHLHALDGVVTVTCDESSTEDLRERPGRHPLCARQASRGLTWGIGTTARRCGSGFLARWSGLRVADS